MQGLLDSRKRLLHGKSLTLFGRSVALISGEVLANAVIWIAAGICFAREADGLLGLALLAWTIGLRHGLDADHISAIDNATRQLVSLGQLPITCGLWFSLGHSTIVIVVNVALAISIDIYDRLDSVGSVGGIIGASISASFLFLIACINIYYLNTAIRERRAMKRAAEAGQPLDVGGHDASKIHGGGCLVRIVGPLLRTVDRPWKMYPVGVLFGFGFDTASSIALLAISAVAQRGANGQTISHGKIVILPFLFTAGMTMVDSLDSVLMLYAYAAPSQDRSIKRFAMFFNSDKVDTGTDIAPVEVPDEMDPNLPILHHDQVDPTVQNEDQPKSQKPVLANTGTDADVEATTSSGGIAPESGESRVLDAKANTISSLSITLTILSILVALSISLITIMGLIGENCSSCTEAAEDPDGGGLAGSWWRGWAKANDQSGYIGAGIVGCFAAILLGYHGGKWAWRRYGRRKGIELEV